MALAPTDASVHQLFRSAGFSPPQKITWLKNKGNPFYKACFAGVEDAAQMDAMIRCCRRQPGCVAGFEVSAEVSTRALEVLEPCVVLQLVPATRSQPNACAEDVARIVAAAQLPDPLSMQFRQEAASDTFMLRYIVPGQCGALISHCHAHAVYWRDGVSWNLDCRYKE